MLSNSDVGEDSWESLGMQGDQTSHSKEINPEYSLEGLMLKLRLQYFDPTDARSQLIGKDPDARKDWGQKEKSVREDEILVSLTQSMDLSLIKLQEIVKDREA